MFKVSYFRGGEEEVFGPFVDDESAMKFGLEMGGTPKFWVDNESRVGLQYENGEWRTTVR